MNDAGDPTGNPSPPNVAPEPTCDDPATSVPGDLIEDLVTYCPSCYKIHLDVGEWYNRPHKTHLCLHCGHLWRPKEVPTRGVMPPEVPSPTTPVSGPISSDIPLPPAKRYAHHGKRRRRFTEELFRCPCVDKISRSDLVCNALLWRNRPAELRAHLHEHLSVDQIGAMSDDEVVKWYTEAKRIFLQGIPEDLDEDEDFETEGDPDDEQED